MTDCECQQKTENYVSFKTNYIYSNYKNFKKMLVASFKER